MKKQSIGIITLLFLINIGLRVYLSSIVLRVAVDTGVYQSLADSIKSGKGFSLDNRAIVDYAPLYPLLLAIVDNRDRLVVVQNIFGLLSILGLMYLVYESKKWRNTYLALILWNLYIPLTSINFKLLSESLAIFLLISFMVVVKFSIGKKWQWQILVGFLWGLLALTRIAYGYVGIAYLLWLLIEKRHQRGLIKLIYGLFLGFLLTMGVWNVRCLAVRGLTYPSFYLGRYVVKNEACSNNLCKSLDILDEKVEKKTGANLWWYLIWKPRQMWDRGDIDSKLPKDIIVWFNRYHVIFVLTSLTVSLWGIGKRGITRLLCLMVWIGIGEDMVSWSQVRYVMPLIPLLIAGLLMNIVDFKENLKKFAWWWLWGLLVGFVFSFETRGWWIYLSWVWLLWLWKIGFIKIRHLGLVGILITTIWWGAVLSIWPNSINNFLKTPMPMWKFSFPFNWIIDDRVID